MDTTTVSRPFREILAAVDADLDSELEARSPRPQAVEAAAEPAPDLVNHPPHYLTHPSGVECIEITRWMNFNCGNAVKYIWRHGDKGAMIEDLEKAVWYLNDEIVRLKKVRDNG